MKVHDLRFKVLLSKIANINKSDINKSVPLFEFASTIVREIESLVDGWKDVDDWNNEKYTCYLIYACLHY